MFILYIVVLCCFAQPQLLAIIGIAKRNLPHWPVFLTSLAGKIYLIGRYRLPHWPVKFTSLAGITYLIGRYWFSMCGERAQMGSDLPHWPVFLTSLAGKFTSLAGMLGRRNRSTSAEGIRQNFPAFKPFRRPPLNQFLMVSTFTWSRFATSSGVNKSVNRHLLNLVQFDS